MSLTNAQLLTIKAAIQAETDPELVTARINGQTSMIASFYNQEASPAFYIWRKVYTSEQIAEAIDIGITQLDALTGSKRDSLLWWASRNHDASLATTQAAINDLCGSQNTLKNAVLDGGKRKLNRAEKLFATGTGSLASPGTTEFEGNFTEAIVNAAMGAQ